MSSVVRIFAILDLFDENRPFWTAEEIIGATGFSRPTTFRCLRELCQSGLLARFARGYVLGPKAVKLDYVVRQSDPLLHLFDPILQRLCDDTECDVIFATLLGDEFFATIHIESRNATVSWSRGRTMPLTRGAGGLAVLATLPTTHKNRLFAKSGIEGTELADLKSDLKAVARQGYAVSLGALDDENAGIAVPVMLAGTPPAALVLVMRRKRFETSDLSIFVRLLNDARAKMTDAYAATESLSGIDGQQFPKTRGIVSVRHD